MATTTRTIIVPSELDPLSVFGPEDRVIREVEQEFSDLDIAVRGNRIMIMSHSPKDESRAEQAQNAINAIIASAYGNPMDVDTVPRMFDRSVLRNSVRRRMFEQGKVMDSTRSKRSHSNVRRAGIEATTKAGQVGGTKGSVSKQTLVPKVLTGASGTLIRPKTAGQAAYVNTIVRHIITFVIGPAGTGKTYLAVARAVRDFSDGKVRRIILTRPAVEAGESLGFLPGTLNEKVDPYLRPLYDALSDMLGADRMHRFMEDGSIEVAPLAYMRGRTLNDAFVILDEAQNTTEQQMKMFLTRLGFNTTMVVTGDVSQADLALRRSGLSTIEDILRGIDDVAFVHLNANDVVRHRLVGRIVEAYDLHSALEDGVRRASRRKPRRAAHGELSSVVGSGDSGAAQYIDSTPEQVEGISRQ